MTPRASVHREPALLERIDATLAGYAAYLSAQGPTLAHAMDRPAPPVLHPRLEGEAA